MLSFTLLAIPVLIFAACATGSSSGVPQEIVTAVTNITNGLIYLAGTLTVLFIVIAGIMFIWNGGDTAKLQTAKNMILYAAVGFAITVLSTAIKIWAQNLACGT